MEISNLIKKFVIGLIGEIYGTPYQNTLENMKLKINDLYHYPYYYVSIFWCRKGTINDDKKHNQKQSQKKNIDLRFNGISTKWWLQSTLCCITLTTKQQVKMKYLNRSYTDI